MRHVVTYVFLCLGLMPGAPQAATVSGQVSVMDGDTLEMHGQRIRLHGIDAPESPQSCHLPDGKTWRCGHTAALRLRDFIGDKTVTCERNGQDRYGRIVAVCAAGGEDLGAWLVEHGWALAYARYSKAYVEQQTRAAAVRAGIWRSRFQKPWEWRLAPFPYRASRRAHACHATEAEAANGRGVF
jgi:endonuclease YncB( thermonuclease family)